MGAAASRREARTAALLKMEKGPASSSLVWITESPAPLARVSNSKE